MLLTMQPQAFLGVAINWSALVGWAAVRGNFSDIGTILPIFIGAFFWTLAYDTTYAHQVSLISVSKCPLVLI